MENQKFKVRLGMFVFGGILLFVVAIFLIGKKKNLFNPVLTVKSTFKNVSGLQVGNNVRFSGINVGTVDDILILNDSVVLVDMLIDKKVQKFLRTDCRVTIGSDGVIGDRMINITSGSPGAVIVKEGQYLPSNEPIETDAILGSFKVSVENAEVVTHQLAEILYNINNGNGTLGRLIKDEQIADNLDQTIENLKQGSAGLNENMEAAKSNFLLKGYFKKKEKEEDKRKKEAEENKKK